MLIPLVVTYLTDNQSSGAVLRAEVDPSPLYKAHPGHPKLVHGSPEINLVVLALTELAKFAHQNDMPNSKEFLEVDNAGAALLKRLAAAFEVKVTITGCVVIPEGGRFLVSNDKAITENRTRPWGKL
jgi:hypothetical protein